MSESRNVTPEELDAEAVDLPDREAMSLIDTSGGSVLSTTPTDMGVGGFGDTGGVESGATDTASGSTDAASGPTSAATDAAATDAQASGSAQESTTEADRSEQISQSDTAVASS
jgi:hypothetical protein